MVNCDIGLGQFLNSSLLTQSYFSNHTGCEGTGLHILLIACLACSVIYLITDLLILVFFRKELCDKLYMNIQVFVDRLYSYYIKKDKISFKKYIFDNLNWTLFIKFNKISVHIFVIL